MESFIDAIDLLHAGGARRIGILGASKGAEAALLTAVHDPRVDVVTALSPTSRVWCNVGPSRDGERLPYRSCWTWREQPPAAWRPAMADDVLNYSRYSRLGRLTSLDATQLQLIRSLPDDPIGICAAAHGLVIQLIFA